MPRAKTLWAALISCAAILLCDSVVVAQVDARDTRSCAELTADWRLWSALSQHPWSQKEIDQKVFFSLDRLKVALHAVPLTAPVRLMGNETEDYAQKNPGRPGVQAYSAAAELYKAGAYKKAVPLFDQIVADRDSSYRAAAAYTAARATLLLGDLEGAGVRIDALVRDPTLQDFAGQAYDLFSKIRYQSDAAPLNAAEMSQIGFLLTAPSAAVCGSPAGEWFRRKVDDEFSELVGVPLTYNRWNRFTSRTIASTVMVKLDPVLDFASVVRPQSKFDTRPYGRREEGWKDPAPMELLVHIRERWDATRNPLWAVTLAEHATDESDLNRITASLQILRAWPGLPAPARARYAWRIAAQVVRIKLIAGKIDEALAAASLLTSDDLIAARTASPQPDIVMASRMILADGIRWFVRSDDFASARRWALEAARQFGLTVPEELKPLLVRNLDELYDDPVLGLRRSNGIVELENARGIFDIYSSHQLIEISRRSDLAPDDRRAFVGAAWTRAYMLEHWPDVIGWLPDMARAYPELDDDIRNVRHAWFRGGERHGALLMMLRTPGLHFLPSWSRPPGGPEYRSFNWGTRSDIRKFDYGNPSDGNWWCSPGAAELKMVTGNAFVDMALENRWIPDLFEGEVTPEKIEPANRAIAAYPLLKAADSGELARLANTGSSSKRLAEAAVKWGDGITWFDRLLGRDRDVPEALARAVAATRHGCRRPPENGPWSRAAYELLHRDYPDSDWAKQTKYWFDTVHQ
jgi:hypothetical protein